MFTEPRTAHSVNKNMRKTERKSQVYMWLDLIHLIINVISAKRIHV